MLRTLELQHIRSYVDGLFEFTDGVNIIVGPNASGKTNLLEAIHMMCRGSGFKSSDGDMIARGSEWARIDASFGEHERTVKLKGDAKEFIIDDNVKMRLSPQTLLSVVLFEPNHMLLLGGEPERRRSYIDGILVQTEPTYHRTLQDFKKALAQRNRLLKQEHVSPEHIFVWDVRLSELGGGVAAHRARYGDVLNSVATKHYQSVSGTDEHVSVRYDTKIPLESYVESYLKKLQQDFELDRVRGFTGSGPHRDDLSIAIDGHDARTSASRGETRSIVLALKIAEMHIVAEKTGRRPLLLLDDVFSELDGKRRRKLATALRDHQSFITTTDADAIIKSYLSDYHVITTNRA